MRRRRSLDVWPAFADLMTVLAIVGLFTTLALSNEREIFQQQVREAAQNETMFQAIQEAQRLIKKISHGSGLSFGEDQSLQFGDDLVTFKLNSVEPIWKKDSREQLKKFCESVSRQLEIFQGNSMEGRFLFVVQVEGHTDSSQCPGQPDCNWQISSSRAAEFVTFMRKAEYCPQGERLNLRPVGYADTKPLHDGVAATRRITIRLVPDYERIIRTLKAGGSTGV